MKARKLTLLADISGYFCFLFGRNPGDGTQGPENAEQTLYHGATPLAGPTGRFKCIKNENFYTGKGIMKKMTGSP